MEFRAAGLSVPNEGNPAEWAMKLHQLCSAGGVHRRHRPRYRTFVHMDVRGSNFDCKDEGVP